MQIQLNNIGQRYNYEWIFRNINQTLVSENNYVILGANGSGKSTLLQLIAGSTIASEGTIGYYSSYKQGQHVTIPDENIFRQLSFASPYLDLFEEFTLLEAIYFHAQFKPFFEDLKPKEVVKILNLEKAHNKQLKYFSSGMKQRVRLALAILSHTTLLLLDEPTSNLDKAAIDWYQKLVDRYATNRLIIVASNQQEYEYPFCNKQLNIEDFK